MTLADKLNKYEASFNLLKTGVKLEASPEDDSLFDAEGNVTDAEFLAFLDGLEAIQVYVDYDPRHKDAGLVVYAEAQEERAWFDATGECAWVDC